MNRTQKEQELKGLTERLQAAKALIFTGYRGLKVSEIGELRSKLRKEQSQLKVIKNRLAKRALSSLGLDTLAAMVDGPTAVASSAADPVASAKVMVEFAKEHEVLVLRGGLVEGRAVGVKDLQALAALPPREVLLAKMLGSLLAPASNLARTLIALPQKLVMALHAIQETKASSSSTTGA